MTKVVIALLALLTLGGCAGVEPDKHWQSNPYGAKTFWEDRDRRSGGSAE